MLGESPNVRGIQDNLGFWIPAAGSVELGFWIPIISGISDSLSCIPVFPLLRERTLYNTARALEHSFSYVVKPQVHFSLSPTQWVISVDCLLLATAHSTNAPQVHYRLPFSVVLERNLDLVP